MAEDHRPQPDRDPSPPDGASSTEDERDWVLGLLRPDPFRAYRRGNGGTARPARSTALRELLDRLASADPNEDSRRRPER